MRSQVSPKIPTKNDVSVQKDFTVRNLVDDMKGCLGYVVSSESGHGKSFLAFSIVREALKQNVRTVIFSPSTVWNRKFGACKNLKLVKVGTADFSPVMEYDKEEFERLGHGRDTFFLNTDKKYMFKRSLWLEKLLADDSLNLLFEIHYLNSRKAKTFITECLKLIFKRERQKLLRNHEYDHHTLAVLEECQNSYGTYNLNDDSSLEALSILSMGRTDSNLHFLAITQRLAETSVKVTERLRLISGLQIGFNSLNRVKAQVDMKLKKLVQRLPKRTFLYVNGKDNPVFQIPKYPHKGKLEQLLRPRTEARFYLVKPKRKRGILETLKFLLCFENPFKKPQAIRKGTSLDQENNEEQDEITEEETDFRVYG